MKTLYVTDLDGTLLNRQSRINPYSLDIINALVEKGVLFTYATARSLASASVVARGLQINIPFLEALKQMPTYAKFMKGLLTKKYPVPLQSILSRIRTKFLFRNPSTN